MCKDRTNITNCKESPLKNGSDSLKKKAKVKIISHNFTRKLSEKNPDSKLMKAYMDAHVCSNVYTVQGGKAHSHYCHRAFCPICQRIQTAQNVKKFLPVMKYLASEGREFYFVTLTLQNCVTDDARVLRDFMRRCNRMWADGIRTKHKFRSLGISGVIKKECTYHVVKKDLFSFHYHFHIIVDSLEAAKYVVAQWKKLHGSTVADARFQKYKKIEDFENAAIEVFKYASKASVSKSKGRDGKKKIQINYKALDMIYTAMHGMQRIVLHALRSKRLRKPATYTSCFPADYRKFHTDYIRLLLLLYTRYYHPHANSTGVAGYDLRLPENHFYGNLVCLSL